jgi:predicted dehydrogenase
LSPVNVGIAGCGHIATVAHIPLLRRMRGVNVSAVADPDPERLDHAARLAPGASRYREIEELLSRAGVDAVVIASPTALHARHALAAFQDGVHVYLEKPVAASVADALAVIAEWRTSGKIGAIGHNFRFNPVYARLATMAQGAAHFETEFTVPRPPARTWRSATAEGGGALLDLGTHHIDLVRFLSNSEVSTVSAKIESEKTDEDHVVIEMVLESGATARIACGYGDAFVDRIAIEHKSGRIQADRSRSDLIPFPGRILHIAKKVRSPLREPSFELSLASFIQAVLSGTQTRPDLEDGLASLEAAVAARQSASSGLPITMGHRHLVKNV